MREQFNEIISHMPRYMDQYKYKTKAEVTLQVEDMKQYAKMVQLKWLSRGYCNMPMMSTFFRNSLQRVPFDLDSQPLMFDDGASASIINDLWDYVTRPTAITCKVKGIAGSAKATYHGTVKWKIEDDNNIIHTFVIPNTYYIAAAPTRILSPQHFAQQMQDHKPHAEGTG